MDKKTWDELAGLSIELITLSGKFDVLVKRIAQQEASEITGISKPTIEELESLLNSADEEFSMEVLPDGSIQAVRREVKKNE